MVMTISREEVLRAVKKDLGSDLVKILEYTIKPASETPLGFLGDHKHVKGKVEYDNKVKEFQYFAKFIPTKVPSHREYAEKTRQFFKEIELYKTLFDDMKNALSPNRQSIIKWRPDCVFTRDWDVVVLEDLFLQGYYMIPERTLMDLEHMKITIKTLARMSAGALILEAKLKTGQATTHSKSYKPGSDAASVEDLYPDLIFESECIKMPGHPGYRFWEAGIRSQLAVIDVLPAYTAEQKEKVKKQFPEILRQVYEMAKPSLTYKNVIVHGDLWGNNILFQNGPDGKVAQAVVVDFQLARYSPPAQDLLVLLHIMQDRAFRQKYEQELTNLYYEFLRFELEEEGIDINKFITKAEFDDSLKYYKKFAILVNIIYMQLNKIPPEATAKYLATAEAYEKMMLQDRSEMLVELFHDDELTHTLQIEAMDEMIEMYNML